MKVLVQNCLTNFYLAENGDWKVKASEGFDFLSISNAVPYCFKHEIQNYQIVLKFREEGYDIVLDGRTKDSLKSLH